MDKRCSKCKEIKSLDEFNIDKNRKFGVTCACKKCRHPNKIVAEQGHKFCTTCKIQKEFNQFSKCSKNSTGLTSSCKECQKIIRENKLILKIPNITGFKTCTKCKITKTTDNFYESSIAVDGFAPNCKECKSKHYYDNSARIAVRNKEFYDLNYPEIRRRRQFLDSQDEQKQKIKLERALEIEFKKHITSIKRKVKNLIGSSFKRALNGQYIKSVRTEQILGCTPLYFKHHIESQFLNWMSWENHGNECIPLEYNCSWDLDHIIPISQAMTEEDIVKLNHWSNIQPLCSKINRHDKKEKVLPVTNLELKITINN